MTLDEFREIDRRHRLNKPGLFQDPAPDRLATDEDLAEVERLLAVTLPTSYRAFLKEFGGGPFGYVTLFSAQHDGEWYLPTKHAEASQWLPPAVVAFSDDFCGGNYVFKVSDGQAEDQIYYWDEGGLIRAEYDDVFEFVASQAYEPA